jgi:hypothetical protein
VTRATLLFAVLLMARVQAVHAGQDPAALNAAATVVDGPPAPVGPAVITRDDEGRATVRAVRTPAGLDVDGRLDESIYESVLPIDGFIQQEPRNGEPGTERTDVWVLFDDETLYISVKCWDSQPDRWVRSGLQRDVQNITDSENFVVILDTFYDRRNGFYFQTNLAGAIRDQVITDEGNPNGSWNTVWTVRTGRFAGGWSIEMAIPFKSLRYRGSGEQIWGINMRRIVRWKNEATYLTRVPSQYGTQGIYRLSVAGTLVGLQTPAQSKNIEVKPYVVSSLTTDHAAAVPYANDLLGDAGVDFKYGLTRSLIADFTYNTDFAQVEEDLQQVNLTRFSLFFPEKRDFFLEGQGIFAFGGASAGGGGGGGSAAPDVPILFFSRRIGLSGGQPVPVIGGGRLTGKVGPFDVGALNIVSDDEESAGAVQTNFSVVRLKRGILRQSYVGLIAAHRSPSTAATGDNLTLGADMTLALSRTLTITSYLARTRSSGRAGDETSYRGRFDYSTDRYGVEAEQLKVGSAFNPEIGFMRREDFRRTSGVLRFSPRPKSSRRIRKFTYEYGLNYVTNGAGERLQTRENSGRFALDLQTGDQLNAEATASYELVEQPFRISGVAVPVGGYDFTTVTTGYTLGPQRKIAGRITVATGSFYGGTRTEAAYSAGRLRLSPHLEVEPGLSVNRVSLPQGDLTTGLVSTRTSIMPSARMLISSLIQYNSTARSLNSSVRLRWEYTSGSELFLVYSDGRVTTDPRLLGLINRSLALKITRLVRF